MGSLKTPCFTLLISPIYKEVGGTPKPSDSGLLVAQLAFCCVICWFLAQTCCFLGSPGIGYSRKGTWTFPLRNAMVIQSLVVDAIGCVFSRRHNFIQSMSIVNQMI